MSVYLTLSYDWNRSAEANPLPFFCDMPDHEHAVVEGEGGGSETWQYALDLMFDNMEHAVAWSDYIKVLPAYAEQHANITWRNMERSKYKT